MRDIRDASFYENYVLPKVYYKQYYSIEAAIHHRVVVCVPRRLAATVLLLLASVPNVKMEPLAKAVLQAPSQQLLLPVVLEPLVPLPLVLHLPLLPLPKQFRFCGNLSRVFALLVSLLSGSCRECCAPISVNDFAGSHWLNKVAGKK